MTIRLTPRLWQALEAAPGPAGVLGWWRRTVGPEFPLIEPWLRPCAELAPTYPRLRGFGPPLEVVHHSADDVEAVCPENGDVLTLSRSDLVIYELDFVRLGNLVASLLGVASAEPLIDGPRRGLEAIGVYRPVAGQVFPVVMWLARSVDEFKNAVRAITTTRTPKILATPTGRFLDDDSQTKIDEHGSAVIVMNELLGIDEQGRWVALDQANEIIDAFRQRHVPQSSPSTPRFPTPPDATWRDVRIRFVDGHTISIGLKSAHRSLNYAEIGMADGRNGRPSKQWDLLREFARGQGLMTWQSPGACRKNQKRRELLGKSLAAFFRIEGDPIELTKDGQGWQTRFRIEGSV